jgi:hypothetical protein
VQRIPDEKAVFAPGVILCNNFDAARIFIDEFGQTPAIES